MGLMRFYYPDAPFMVHGFHPPRLSPGDHGMGRWGFGITLGAGFARRCIDVPITPAMLERSSARAIELLRLLFPEPHMLGEHEQPLAFQGGGFLLTNISVPGNACGLDMDWSDLRDINGLIELGGIHQGLASGVGLLPHNVDGWRQANALLTLWLDWYQTACAIIDWPSTLPPAGPAALTPVREETND
jgi:hypothetical protein